MGSTLGRVRLVVHRTGPDVVHAITVLRRAAIHRVRRRACASCDRIVGGALNDIGYRAPDVLGLFADYYNAVPDGVVNDRFTILPGLTHHDYVTPEFSVLSEISAAKFETVRGMGRGFGYNRNEGDADLDSAEELIHLLVDVVSKNELFYVGPLGRHDSRRSDGAARGSAHGEVNGERFSRPPGRARGGNAAGGRGAITAPSDDEGDGLRMFRALASKECCSGVESMRPVRCSGPDAAACEPRRVKTCASQLSADRGSTA